MKIEFDDETRKNLIAFLNRVDLIGSEVPAYVEIVEALNKPFLEEVKVDKKK
jgi:hypothetical protein